MIEIVRYQPEDKLKWNRAVEDSKNGTFLFHRDYMDYHSDRFNDCSFFILRKGVVVGLIPANEKENVLYSHQGLTYGGLLLSSKLTISDVLSVFEVLTNWLKANQFEKVIYKPIPYIYHKIAAQEDIYALFVQKAKKIACNISSTIYQTNQLKFIESRKSGIRKAKNLGLEFKLSEEYIAFWELLNQNLEHKYGKNAVHSVSEMTYLASKFPNNIKLYTATSTNGIVAGTVIYEMGQTIHVQYISANEEGKNSGALDLIFDELIFRQYSNCQYFDFGQSTEDMGNYLNERLIFQKEGFGGRGTVYETYEIDLI